MSDVNDVSGKIIERAKGSGVWDFRVTDFEERTEKAMELVRWYDNSLAATSSNHTIFTLLDTFENISRRLQRHKERTLDRIKYHQDGARHAAKAIVNLQLFAHDQERIAK